jgi:predicted SnoaL-like aldol condensation-catalyzing enzyme
LDHSIKAQPGGISEPEQIVTLEKEDGKTWKARKLSEDELGQHNQMIKTMDDEFPNFIKKIFSQPPSQPIPTVASQNP